MASKHSRTTKTGTPAAAGDQLGAEYDRLIQKKKYKDAVKQAKLCYKQESSPQNRARLERAYYLRAKELSDLGMRDSAREVLGHLLEFGVNPSEWSLDLGRLLIALGLGQKALQIQDRLGSAEDKARFTEAAADMAVLHPERARPISPEVEREASLIRDAIDKLESGDESGATVLVRDLARSSVLSEWKYFIKGLAAFHKHDTEAQEANWSRLDSHRAAARIAKHLRSLAPSQPARLEGPPERELEKLVFGGPVITQIRQLSLCVAEQDWPEVVRQLGPLRAALHQVDPKLAERLTGCLIGPLIKHVSERDPHPAERLIDRFTKVAEPLSIDPNWNRLRGLGSAMSGAPETEARTYWSRYIEDLNNIPGLPPQERSMAQALVLNHIAKSYELEIEGDEQDDEEDEIFGPFVPYHASSAHKGKTIEAVYDPTEAAVECLEESLRLAPDYLPTYRALVDIYEAAGDDDQMAAAAARLLAKFPDDLETLSLLAEHFRSQDEPEAALQWAQRARKLKPLDESLREDEWAIRLDLARKHALAKRFEEGRAEFATAEQLFPERCHDYAYLAQKAVLEAKARQADRSAALITEAQRSLLEPAPLWLALLIQANHYEADRKLRAEYARRWTAELKKPVKSETAGEMARLLDSVMTPVDEYPDLSTHVNKLVTYLGRTLKLKYRRVDIEHVCDFLGKVSESGDLLKKLVKRGLSSYPESVRLHFEAALIEFRLGPVSGSLAAARQHFARAVELAGSSTDRADQKLLPQIKEMLSQLNDLAESPLGSLFFGGFPMGPPAPAQRQSRPKSRRRSKAKSSAGGPFQMDFLDFFDDDEPGPDWF